MKEFFRSMLGSCLGVIIAFLLVFLILFGMGAALSSSGGSASKADLSTKNGVLRLKFDNVIPEKTDNVASDFMSGSSQAMGLREMGKVIASAAKDNDIKGIVINANSVSMGQATMLQVMEYLRDFKKQGKFIYAYADGYSQGSYLLSSVSDSIYLNPNGSVDLHGFAVVTPFFKGLMDKVGVDFDVFYAGNFKSATEPFRRTNMSDENKLQTREFLNGMMDVVKKELNTNRKIDVPQLDLIMNNLEGRTGEKAVASRLVDRLAYWDQFETALKNKMKLEDEDDINYLSIEDYKTLATIDDGGSGDEKIAIVYAEGEVAYDNNQRGVIDNKKFLGIFDKIEDDKKIKAVVLRVNSGGGSALTSDIIWRELEKIKRKGIPVVASFGDYAASGGYYIAAGADKIVAAPNTLTGSIGVFSMLPNFKKVANEKLGITFDTIKTHQNATSLNNFYALSEVDKKIMTESTDMVYSQFLDRVSAGRKMTKDAVHQIAQGRVWTGTKAKEIGLVDEIGDLDDAIALAAKLAKLKEYRTTEYPKLKKDVWSEIFREVSRKSGDDDEAQLLHLNERNKSILNLYTRYKVILENDGVQARLLHHYEF